MFKFLDRFFSCDKCKEQINKINNKISLLSSQINKHKKNNNEFENLFENLTKKINDSFKEELRKLDDAQKKAISDQKKWIMSPSEIAELKSLALKNSILDNFMNRVIDLETKMRDK